MCKPTIWLLIFTTEAAIPFPTGPTLGLKIRRCCPSPVCKCLLFMAPDENKSSVYPACWINGFSSRVAHACDCGALHNYSPPSFDVVFRHVATKSWKRFMQQRIMGKKSRLLHKYSLPGLILPSRSLWFSKHYGKINLATLWTWWYDYKQQPTFGFLLPEPELQQKSKRATLRNVSALGQSIIFNPFLLFFFSSLNLSNSNQFL